MIPIKRRILERAMDQSLTSRVHQDNLGLASPRESNAKSITIIRKVRSAGANEIKENEVSFTPLNCVDSPSLESSFHTQACLERLRKVLNGLLVLHVRFFVWSNDEDGPTINPPDLTETWILKQLRDAIHDPALQQKESAIRTEEEVSSGYREDQATVWPQLVSKHAA